MPRRLTVRITNKPTGKLRTTRTLCRPEDVFGSGTDHAAARTLPLAGQLGAGPAVTAEVTGDLVTLHGVVERAYPKSCAEAIVRRVPSVIGVRNEIAVCEAQEFG